MEEIKDISENHDHQMVKEYDNDNNTYLMNIFIIEYVCIDLKENLIQ